MTRAYYLANRERILRQHERYRRANWQKVKTRRQQHYQENKARLLQRMADYYAKDKEPAINIYSNGRATCEWCNQGDMDVLTLDHIANDGFIHRQQIGKGAHLYRWLQAHDYPPGFQVLCLNCNFKKHLQECRQKRKV